MQLHEQRKHELGKIYCGNRFGDIFGDKSAKNSEERRKIRKIDYSKIKLKHKIKKPQTDENVATQNQTMKQDKRKLAFAALHQMMTQKFDEISHESTMHSFPDNLLNF